MKRYLFILLIFTIIASCVFAQEPDTDERNTDAVKAQLFVQKGDKAMANGEFDEAVAAYEEAYQTCKNNVQPLLKLAIILSKVGMYDLAEKRLREIPLEKLNDAGQSEVLTLMGKVAIAKNSLGEAGDCLRKALKAQQENSSARIRLAMVNLMLGMTSRAEELIAKELGFDNYASDELGMCLAIDLYSANFGRAYNTCEILGKRYIEAHPKSGFFDIVQKQPWFMFISYLPLFLSRSILLFYLIFIFSALAVSANALTKNTTIWHVVTFVFVGVALMVVAHNCCINNVYNALLTNYCYIFDGIWILPKIIIAMHLVALSLFAIFPMFKLLRENMRPATYELLGIWMFCFFFGIFVLSFQSHLEGTSRFLYMLVGLFCSILSALIMPLGRLVVYNLSELTGIKILGNVSESKVVEGCLSFTDAKIMQAKMWDDIGRGMLEEVLSVGRKYGNADDLRSFPDFWLALIVAQICNEDYDSAARNLAHFSQMFNGTEYNEIGQIYEAFLKTEKGDFPIAYKLVNSISPERAQRLNQDESATSLLVLARCSLSMRDNVLAHINFNKAYATAKSQYLKLIALADMAELDCQMKAKQAMLKWSRLLQKMQGEGRCKTYMNLINSMVAYCDGRNTDAHHLAKECLNDNFKCGKAVGWYGHILCEMDKTSEAEELLERMTPGSHWAEKLMTEVTSKGLS